MTEEMRNIISITVEETIKQMNNQDAKNKNKDAKNYCKDTEKLLYSFPTLKDHVEDRLGYFHMLDKRHGGSYVRYAKNKTKTNEYEMYLQRIESLRRSEDRVRQIDEALDAIRNRKEYRVIELTYFEKKKNGDRYTQDEIVEILKSEGINICSKTMRTWRSMLVKELSVRLFGADAL